MNFEKKYKWFTIRKWICMVLAVFFFLVFIIHFFTTVGTCEAPDNNYNLALLSSVMIAFYALNLNMFMMNIAHEYSMATLDDREATFNLEKKYLYLHKKKSYGIMIILFFITLIAFAAYNFKAYFFDHTVHISMAILYCIGMALYSWLVLSNVERSNKNHNRIVETKGMYDRNMARLAAIKAMKSEQGGNDNV